VISVPTHGHHKVEREVRNLERPLDLLVRPHVSESNVSRVAHDPVQPHKDDPLNLVEALHPLAQDAFGKIVDRFGDQLDGKVAATRLAPQGSCIEEQRQSEVLYIRARS